MDSAFLSQSMFSLTTARRSCILSSPNYHFIKYHVQCPFRLLRAQKSPSSSRNRCSFTRRPFVFLLLEINQAFRNDGRRATLRNQTEEKSSSFKFYSEPSLIASSITFRWLLPSKCTAAIVPLRGGGLNS